MFTSSESISPSSSTNNTADILLFYLISWQNKTRRAALCFPVLLTESPEEDKLHSQSERPLLLRYRPATHRQETEEGRNRG